MDLEILGPLVVRVGGRQIQLGPRLRILLLGLVCGRGDLIPAARLGRMLSETHDVKQGSAATLRSHISHLRRALNDAGTLSDSHSSPVLITDKIGGSAAYALRVQADRVDATRFERAVAAGICELHSGNHEHAGQVLREAISLWRGKPFADAADHAFAQPDIRRLENSYRAAVIARVQADLQRGLYRTVIGELEAMTALWPDDEAVRELLIVSLHRSGRTAEAAQACRVAIETALERGLDSRRFAALQRDVLNGSLPGTGLFLLPAVSNLSVHTPPV
jgi:DNA-binding SARP family transcriptional activator